MTTSRQFLQSASNARNAVRELLQVTFSAELLAPSRCIWLVSPWLRDLPVLDNTTGAFTALCPDLPRTDVRVSVVLRELMNRGTRVVIAVRPDAGNRQLVDALGGAQASELTFLERTELHAKGLVGDRYSLVGSMNFTFNGLERLTEMLIFQTDPSAVEQLRLAFRDEYGGIA